MNDPTPTPPRMTDQAPELLPCPLCGVTLVLSGDYTHESAWNFWSHPDRDAQCILADYQIPTAQDMRTPLAHEAKMWNTRPTPAERPSESLTEGCIICANGNDLPDGEHCRACGREGLATGLRAAVIKARGRQEPPTTPIRFERPSDAAVAWRWKPRGASNWILAFDEPKHPSAEPLYALPPDEPARVTPSTVETPWVCACCGTRGVTDGKSSRVTEPQPPSTVGGEAINAFLVAWDSLPTGSHSARAVNNWLNSDKMKDAIAAIRALSSTIASEKECGKAVAKPRFFIDHDMIHDRVTGKHVVTNGTPPFEDSVEQVCDLLNSLAPPPASLIAKGEGK